MLFQFLQVFHCQFEHVSLFQLGDGLALGLQGIDHDVFEVVQAFVDPGTSLPFKQRLHHFSVLGGPGHGCLVCV